MKQFLSPHHAIDTILVFFELGATNIQKKKDQEYHFFFLSNLNLTKINSEKIDARLLDPGILGTIVQLQFYFSKDMHTCSM